jgi:hypothetical protein
MPSTSYLQVSVISLNTPLYTVNPLNSEGEIKSSMVRVNIEENDSTLAGIGTKVYSKRQVFANLEHPILIEIPINGAIGEKNTALCGYTTSSGNTISISGVNSTVGTSTVI